MGELNATEQRTAALAQLPARTWDLLVIGAGISGAGVAQQAARRGWSVLLLEQRDFAWGTSSRSSKLVHGGLRYLKEGDTFAIAMLEHCVVCSRFKLDYFIHCYISPQFLCLILILWCTDF